MRSPKLSSRMMYGISVPLAVAALLVPSLAYSNMPGPFADSICKNETGAALGLCIAGSELALMERDVTSTAFTKLNDNYKRKTGRDLPCKTRQGSACVAMVTSQCAEVDAALAADPNHFVLTGTGVTTGCVSDNGFSACTLEYTTAPDGNNYQKITCNSDFVFCTKENESTHALGFYSWACLIDGTGYSVNGSWDNVACNDIVPAP